MTDYTGLKRMAEAIHGPGSTMQMLARWRAFENACHPSLILALIAENERDELALRAFSRVAENAVAERDQLKAENFQLNAQVDTLTEWYLNALKDAAAIGKDRDQLKAENELLQRAGESLKDQAKQLKADNERLAAILAQQKSRRADDDECLSLATQSIDELRKDAERYRWLKVQKIHVCKDFNDSGLPALGVMVSIRGYEWIGLSENIDAAMGKGEQS